MDLWQGRLADFVNSSRSGALAGAMSGQFAAIHGHQPGDGEFRSWKRSLGALGELLHPRECSTSCATRIAYC